VVAGEDGLDEVSTSAATQVVEVNGTELTRYTLTPQEVGIELADPSDPLLDGGSPLQNADTTQAVFAGERGVRADLVLINAGAAIYASGAADSIAEGVDAARAAIAAGAAAAALERYVQASRKHAPAEVAP
jgi:anthranilate phosphoribosyltransferase